MRPEPLHRLPEPPGIPGSPSHSGCGCRVGHVQRRIVGYGFRQPQAAVRSPSRTGWLTQVARAYESAFHQLAFQHDTGADSDAYGDEQKGRVSIGG